MMVLAGAGPVGALEGHSDTPAPQIRQGPESVWRGNAPQAPIGETCAIIIPRPENPW